MLRTFVCAFFFLIAGSSAHAQKSKAEYLNKFMTALYERGQFTGAVLIAEKGTIIYKKAFGFANREENIPFALNTQEYIGSISKPLTAQGIIILRDRGHLLLTQSVREFFPELPPCMAPVTLTNLLQHTGGLAMFDDTPDMTERDVFDILLKQTTLRFAPGTRFEYCNAGYSLLGMIIAKVSGQSLNEFLTENIFKPCGMNNTTVNEITHRNTARAIGYTMYSTRNNYDTFMGGNASVISTVEDLFRWDQAMYKGEFIKPISLDETFSPSRFSFKDLWLGEKAYGYGWWISTYHGSKNETHDGAFGGYRAYIERQTGEQNTIIHISNLRHAIMTDIREGIVNVMNNRPYVLPPLGASVWLEKNRKAVGIDSAITMYYSLKKSAARKEYTFEERDLNSYGYVLLNNAQTDDAIKVFILNAKEHPNSANVFDSLGEAYLKSGNKPLALETYKKCLSLDPGNENAARMIHELGNGKRP
jgi:CubicO group peptidase (beta-lactamase class C family)